ncbi:MAG: wax ester/triacylglycerol synthase family O-acyltransferase [Actinomycetota bacterium]|nr:wax ester/triacylglycerol synthase family O-acyltransferase [Actinomycetota bacterium]
MADADGEDGGPDHHMSDAEALMWHVEEDPLLSSNIGTVLLCDGPIDHRALRRRMAAAVAAVPRLRERVVAGPTGLAVPQWRVDTDLDLDHHVRHVALPAPATDAALWDLCAHLMADPLDRSRPLWQFWVIDGVGGDRGALLVKLHHTVVDGEGALRLAEQYLLAEADAAEPPEVDLDAVLAAAAEAEAQAGGHRRSTDGVDEGPAAPFDAVGNVLGDALRRPLGGMRRLAAEVMMTAADPARAPEVGSQVLDTVRTLTDQLSTGGRDGGSPLWRARSRRRVLLPFSLRLEPVLAAARGLGGTVNELFLAAAVEAAVRYHDDRDVPLQTLTATFAMSARGGVASAPPNAFTLAKARLAATYADPADRFAQVAEVLRAVREDVPADGNPVDGLAGVANLLPTPWLTQLARSQTRHVDFATSNLRHAPFPVHLGGAKVLANHPIGPLAGTAWNCTLMSYDGSLDATLHVDPKAVDSPGELRDHLLESFGDLMAAAGADAEGLTAPG